MESNGVKVESESAEKVKKEEKVEGNAEENGGVKMEDSGGENGGSDVNVAENADEKDDNEHKIGGDDDEDDDQPIQLPVDDGEDEEMVDIEAVETEQADEDAKEEDGADEGLIEVDQDAQDAAIAQLDGEDSDDEEELKRNLVERIRQIVAEVDWEADNMTKKQVYKMLKREFGSKRVKPLKAYCTEQLKRQVTLYLQQSKEEQDEDAEDVPYEDPEPEPEQEESRPRKRRKERKQRKPKKARLGPAKAKNAYLFFTTDEKIIAKVRAELPQGKAPELMKRKAELWKQASEEEKQVFQELAKQDKERYQLELEEFRRNNPELVEQEEREKQERRRERAQQRKQKRRERNDDYEDDSDGEDERKRESNLPKTELEMAVARLKAERSRKKKKIDEMALQEDAKEFCQRMRDAADVDKNLMATGQPAIHKLKMLSSVVSQLTKCRLESESRIRRRTHTSVRQLLQEAGFFNCIRDWLMIMPNGALPPQRVRHELYKALSEIKISEDDLRDTQARGESGRSNELGLGKVLMRLWAHRDETPRGRKILIKLLQQWIRDVADRSDNYKGLAAIEERRHRQIRQRRRLLGSTKRETTTNSSFNKTVIPMKAVFDYAVRPNSELATYVADEDDHKEDSTRDRIMKQFHHRGRKKGKSSLYTVDITNK
eukprot:CAMPEP_0167766974 /NCGR_PEP_ID=MMETSP0110_2-20121227/15726_1 /TAXON_ID=629695 /ORGANISM="Gymnochlora sp., Strain CCMP2014" /LENGTH=658 /DNA_ID=CAMNT_0007655229 /DNA_START=98 /DNA_END=2074 /DNA_ORIENTATION=-